MSCFLDSSCLVDIPSDSSEAGVSGAVSSDEASLTGSYDSSFVDLDNSSDTVDCEFHTRKEDVLLYGLPKHISQHVPEYSLLSNLVCFADESVLDQISMPRVAKGKVPPRFTEKMTPGSLVDAETARKMDMIVEKHVKKQMNKPNAVKEAAKQEMKAAERALKDGEVDIQTLSDDEIVTGTSYLDESTGKGICR